MKVLLEPNIDNLFTVMKEVRYKDIVVPYGYKTNGANIPRIFWFIVPPFKPKYLPAVVFHDYLSDLGDYSLADRVFEELLLNIEDSIVTRSMICAVKIYHKLRYNTKYYM